MIKAPGDIGSTIVEKKGIPLCESIHYSVLPREDIFDDRDPVDKAVVIYPVDSDEILSEGANQYQPLCRIRLDWSEIWFPAPSNLQNIQLYDGRNNWSPDTRLWYRASGDMGPTK